MQAYYLLVVREVLYLTSDYSSMQLQNYREHNSIVINSNFAQTEVAYLEVIVTVIWLLRLLINREHILSSLTIV